MFGIPSPWLILAALVGFAGYSGVLAYKVDRAAVARTDAKWEMVSRAQKDEARAILDKEVARVTARNAELIEIANRVETEHVAATNEIAAASAKYNRLGLLYERTKARCGPSNSGAPGPDPAPAAVDHGRAGAPEVVSGPADGDTLGAIAADADLMRVTVLACQEYVRGLRPSPQ